MSAHLTMHTSRFAGTKLAPRRPHAAVSRRGVLAGPRADSVLIINTKGGGHAFLGLNLAKELLAAGHKVSILNDGDKVALPHSSHPQDTAPPRLPSSLRDGGPGNPAASAHRPAEQEKVTKKGPYTQYGALESEGVSITWGDPADSSALPEGPFDVVYDNNGKTLEVSQPAIDAYKARVAACSIVTWPSTSRP